MVRLGRDPAGEKIEGRARAAETMGAVVQTYLAQARMRIKPRSYVEVARHLTVYAKPLLGLPLLGINRRTIAARLATVAASNGLVSANRMRTSLSAFFSWCMSQGLLESNPAFGTGRQPEKSRDRVLGSDELEAIWNATAGDDDYPAIVRLLMLTGARANEIGSLAWSEVLEDRIMLPAARAKNGRAHTIPLSRLARAILHARPRRDDDFVFGARKGRPFSGWSTRKMALDQRIETTISPWVLHDFRRTMATWLAETGTAPHIIEAVLNHASGHKAGIAGVYNRAGYEPQKRAALERWGNHIETLVGGKRSAEIVRLGA